jgi:hypothetical protein
MLVDACDHGVESVPNAPSELAAFIQDMERVPSWLDMGLVEQGARFERKVIALAAPLLVRGAFFATFMNKYSALPMAATGTLSSSTAARRVKETSSFFATSVLPGALARRGPGFKSAAMVRLMHAMVRTNILTQPGHWELAIYGIPIPQVDQMPAGLIGATLLSLEVLRKGRSCFTPKERARIELARYRCFLLGLPEDLLADTPRGIVDLMAAREATLRPGFDDSTCGELIRATMAADLRPDASLRSRVFQLFERSIAKQFFVQNFMRGDASAAAKVGIDLTTPDRIRAALALIYMVSRIALYALAENVPYVAELADRQLVERLERLLRSYGHAEFTTDSAKYARRGRAPAAAAA